MLRHLSWYRTSRTAVVGLRIYRRYQALNAEAKAGCEPSAEQWLDAHTRGAAEVHDLTVDLEGLFIKMCQIIGARADLFPAPYVEKLSRFHDKVPPRPFANLKPALERSLGRPLHAVFSNVQTEPLAAASLAQVHRATLLDGTPVVLKIQYPEVERVVRVDLRNLQLLAERFMPRSPVIDARDLIAEMNHFLDMELDFGREAASTERLGNALASDPSVQIPKVYRNLSSSRLLVLGFLDGIPLTDMPRVKASGLDLHAFAERIAKLYAKMIFEVGFFHGDPHPGNLLVLPDGVIGLLDFGLAKELPPTFAQSMASMIVKSFMGDTEGSLAAARELGFNIDELTPELLKEVIASTGQGVRNVRRAEATGEGVGGKPGSRGEASRIRTPVDRQRLGKLVAGGERLKIPPHFALVGRTMMLLDGLSHMLAPGEHLVQRTMREALTPYALGNAS